MFQKKVSVFTFPNKSQKKTCYDILFLWRISEHTIKDSRIQREILKSSFD